jgi:DNA-binding MarR family transcriptional regulator
MGDPLFLVIAVIAGAGVFGGFVNYYLSNPDDVPAPSKIRSVLAGIAASFLVPLFLNMISSNLIELIKAGETWRLLVLLGFCLLAAVSSTAFIRTLSDRVLSEVKNAKRAAQSAQADVKAVQEEIKPILIKETESDDITAAISLGPEMLPNEKKVLLALAEGPYALRSRTGLAAQVHVDANDVGTLLSSLAERGLVGSRPHGQGVRWFITEQGRSYLTADAV